MGGVELGHEEGDVLLHPEGRGVAEDHRAGGRVERLDLPRRARVEGREDEGGGRFRGIAGDDLIRRSPRRARRGAASRRPRRRSCPTLRSLAAT